MRERDGKKEEKRRKRGKKIEKARRKQSDVGGKGKVCIFVFVFAFVLFVLYFLYFWGLFTFRITYICLVQSAETDKL